MQWVRNTILMALLSMKAKNYGLFHHSVDTANVAVEIASIVRPADFTLEDVKCVGLLHDLGKLYIDNAILDKNGALNSTEWKMIALHPVVGASELKKLRSPKLSAYADIVIQHHEMPDGTGYPNKLHICDILELSKIVHVADRFAALTEDRPYRAAFSADFAADSLSSVTSQFFPETHERITELLSHHSASSFYNENEVEKGFAAGIGDAIFVPA